MKTGDRQLFTQRLARWRTGGVTFRFNTPVENWIAMKMIRIYGNDPNLLIVFLCSDNA